MMQFSARAFFWIGYMVQHLQQDCLLASYVGSGEDPLFNPMSPLQDATRNKAKETLRYIEEEANKIGLTLTADTAGEVRLDLDQPLRSRNTQWLEDQISNVRKLLEKEMKGKVFIYVKPEQAKYLPDMTNPIPFGKEVDDAFPSTRYDCIEAACSLAFLRPTAAVFHLMRIMEVALGSLGGIFGVSLVRTNWGPAVDQIEKAVRNMHVDPAWKSKADVKSTQEEFSQAISNFGVLKDAWRNYTMHARGKYTEEEAQQIFENIKFLTRRLASLGIKES